MGDAKDKLIDQVGGVLEKAYDDVVHPSAKSIGNIFSLFPRTIGVWFGKWEKWIINGEESIKLTAEAITALNEKYGDDITITTNPTTGISTIEVHFAELSSVQGTYVIEYEVKAKDFMKISVPFTLTAVLSGYLIIWLFWGIL